MRVICGIHQMQYNHEEGCPACARAAGTRASDCGSRMGVKLDHGKPQVGLMLTDFSHALLAVAEVATYGAKKYGAPSGWQRVPDGLRRYTDALGRHMLAGMSGEEVDAESGLAHQAHLAWNALALLELALLTPGR